MDHGAGFKVAGIVERVFAATSGKFAKVTISCPSGQGKPQKVDVVAFSDTFELIRELGQGEEVQITGTIAMEKLTDKARQEVKVDGYAKWSPMLVAKAVKIGQAPPPPPKAPPIDDDSVPF